MTMVMPKTIVITSLPTKSTMMTSRPITTSGFSPIVTDGLGLNGEPKKRKRLTNLSTEQRLMRRKLKNRVAAQTARDRKKQRMVELEELLEDIEAENRRLQLENEVLRHKTGNLSVENSELKSKLGIKQEPGVVDIKPIVPVSPESAALNSPLQQEQTQTQSVNPMTAFLMMMLTSSLMYSLVSSKKSPAARRFVRRLQRAHIPIPRRAPATTWWGPQQQSWNPSMN